MYKLKINGVEIDFEGGTYLEALRKAGNDMGALAVRIGGDVRELGESVDKNCDIVPITLHDEEGRRIYERSLIFLLLMAMKREFPGVDISCEHSLPQGLYILFKGLKFISNSVIKRLESAMHDFVSEDLPFVKRTLSKDEAIDIFARQGQDDKVRLLGYREVDHFNMYSCGGVENYFYGAMVPSTGYLKLFALELHLPGMVLVQPSAEDISVLTQKPSAPRLGAVFSQSERWGEILDAQVVADLNDMVKNGKIREFIRINEALHEKTISYIADEIYDRKSRLVLVAGPSSSGKTTFTNRLYVQLRANGLRPVIISLDNYYLDREDIPLDENGERDFETLYSIDVKYFNEQLVSLLQGNEVELPIFDFATGKRTSSGKRTKLGDGQPILVEGIHGLNDELTYDVPNEYKYKIFVSALTQLNLDNYNRIRSTDGRLIRRLTRDYSARASSMERTFSMWDSVRRGEDKWIFPYQEQADYIFNTSLSYELAIIKKYLYPLLSAVEKESEYYLEARRLIKFLNYIVDADKSVEEEIPPTSILREFIGGNAFYK